MIFEYRCKRCRHRWDVYRGEDRREQCPECGSFRTEKMVSAPRFILKGSGFYVNDYGIKK